MTTLDQIATNLHIEKRALKATLERADILLSDSYDIPTQRKIYSLYTLKNANRKAETMEAAQQALNELNATVSKTLDSMELELKKEGVVGLPVNEWRTPPTEPTHEHTEQPTNTHKPSAMLFTVFVFVLAWQIVHTASLGFSVCVDKTWFNFGVSYAHAFGLQFTALLLTTRYAKKMFLVCAGVFEFAINLLHYFPHDTLAKILLSLMTAAAIFSYSEMFVQSKKSQTK